MLRHATGVGCEFVHYLQRAAGYTATGSTAEEVAFFAQGPGASSKTTIVEAIRAALGDYARVADFGTFLAGRSDGDGPTPGVARLAGARMVCASEVAAGQKFNAARLKALTGGEMIVARRLHREPVEFRPVFTLWLAANERPAIAASDSGAWRRLRLLPFDRPVPAGERDPAVKRALTEDPAHRAAVLAWIVQGAIEWHRHGLGTCDAVERATAGYQAENDPIADWYSARCQPDPDASTPARELRADYERHCGHHHEQPCTPAEFATALEAHAHTRKRRSAGVTWQGLRLHPVQAMYCTNGSSHIHTHMGKNPQGPTSPTPPTLADPHTALTQEAL